MKQLDWDSPLPSIDEQQWKRILDNLPLLEQVKVHRWLSSESPETLVELHGFADASERGYAAVVYVRIVSHASTMVRLLAAKTKVAPIKPVSLPRLELCAAVLTTNLTFHLRKSLSLFTAPVFLWSDSKVTLQWIQGHASRWKTYVANRVSHIQQQLPQARWRHTPGQDNPADCASRGIEPRDLLNHSQWWTGPSWLKKDPSCWPKGEPAIADLEIPEARTTTMNNVAKVEIEPELLLRFSTLHRLLRVTAWCCRWRRSIVRPRPRANPGATLQPDELEAALFQWLRIVQGQHYSTEVSAIKQDRAVSHRSQLAK